MITKYWDYYNSSCRCFLLKTFLLAKQSSAKMNNNQSAHSACPCITVREPFLFFRSFLPLFVLVFCAGLLSAQQQYRTWTSANGAKLQARMLGFDGAKVTIERSDKQKFVFPLNLLSSADQAYVRQVAGRLRLAVCSSARKAISFLCSYSNS